MKKIFLFSTFIMAIAFAVGYLVPTSHGAIDLQYCISGASYPMDANGNILGPAVDPSTCPATAPYQQIVHVGGDPASGYFDGTYYWEGCCYQAITDADSDGVDDAGDMCPNSTYVQDYNDTWVDLGTNRLADIDADGIFETYHKKTGTVDSGYGLSDTSGCTCADILTEMGDTMKGHWKFGCSQSVMDEWIAGQTPALLPDGEACYTNDECQAGYCNPTLPGGELGYYGVCGYCQTDADCTFPHNCDATGTFGLPGVCIP